MKESLDHSSSLVRNFELAPTEGLAVAVRPRDHRLEDSSAVFVQEVHLRSATAVCHPVRRSLPRHNVSYGKCMADLFLRNDASQKSEKGKNG